MVNAHRQIILTFNAMAKKEKIPVHRRDDWKAGIYLKPFGAVKSDGPDYEVSQAHRHDFYYCVLLEKGSLTAEVDFKTYQISDNTAFFTYPGQVHRIISSHLDKGWFLAFDPAILDAALKAVLDQCLAEVMIFPMGDSQTKLSTATRQLEEIYNDAAITFQQPIIRALTTAFLYQLTGAYLAIEHHALRAYSTRNVEINKKFRQVLRENFRSLKKTSDFAARLNVTTSHLNDTVKLLTGFSVTYFIQQESMREAQRLLSYSELSVKEIARLVGFDDAQYFSRLFSKVVGVPPVKWRNTGSVGVIAT